MFIRFLFLFAPALLLSAFFLPKSVYAAAPTGFDSVQYEDLNEDGRVDLIRIQVNGGEALTNCTVIDPERTSDWTYVGGSIGGTIGAISCTQPTGEIRIGIEGANLVTGHAVAPTISYNNDDGDNSIANASGVLGTVGPVAITDAAAPQITYLDYTDLDGDGKISSFFIIFSEVLDPSSVFKRSHLNFTNEGDFTGIDFGDDDFDLITIEQFNTGFISPEIDLVDTFDDSGELAFETVVGDGTMILTDGVNANTDAKAQTQAIISDGARPVIASISPAEDAEGVDSDTSIIINFSEPMVTDFDEDTQFSVSPAIPGAVWSSAWSNNNQTVTITSSEPFDEEESYTITIDEEEIDSANGDVTNLLLSGPEDGVWTFTIRAGSSSRRERLLLSEGAEKETTPSNSGASIPGGSEDTQVSLPESHVPLFEPGDLIRGESHAAVYLISDSYERQPFLHSSIFFTWFDSFEDVVLVPDDVLSDIPMGGPVLPNPASTLIRFESVDTLYASSSYGVLIKISEPEADSLVGTLWSEYVLPIPIVLWQQFEFKDVHASAISYSLGEMRSIEWLFAQ